MLSGLQTSSGSRQRFEGMLVARQEVLTQSLCLSGGPEGRDLKGTSAALQASTRTTSLVLQLAPCSCTLQVTQRAFAIIQRCPTISLADGIPANIFGFSQFVTSRVSPFGPSNSSFFSNRKGDGGIKM